MSSRNTYRRSIAQVYTYRQGGSLKIVIDTLSITSAKIGQALPTPGLGNGRLPSFQFEFHLRCLDLQLNATRTTTTSSLRDDAHSLCGGMFVD